MKKFKIIALLNIVFALVFSFLNVSFHADLSLVAFPLALIFNALLFYFMFFALLKNCANNSLNVVRKLLQYQPFVHFIAFIFRRSGNFGTSNSLDLWTVIFWLLSFVSSIFLLYFLNEKRLVKVSPEWKKFAIHKKRKGARWLCFEIVDWLDAFFQCIFIVLLVQIFFFQFYVIPSESMVPEMMIKDRIAVVKWTSGPKFPLSEIGLPTFKDYKRGDIVVFRNPHYSMDRKSEIKTVVSNLIYMMTFTIVNLNVDENGAVKADPLVKRVTGVPGEQLLMQDGVLYARTQSSPNFLPVTQDSSWASYNLNSEKPELKKYITDFPITDKQFSALLAVEKMRNELNIENAKTECKEISNKFLSLVGKQNAIIKNDNPIKKDFLTKNELWEMNLFQNNYDLTRRFMSSKEGIEFFNAFMTDWITKIKTQDGYIGGNIFEDSSFRLNLLIKLCFGKIVVRNAELMAQGTSAATWNQDKELLNSISMAEFLHSYAFFFDRRNMCVFPENLQNGDAQYIPQDCYFMMGDNRFNSLDMRHSYEKILAPFTPYDDYSATFYSNLSPQYVHKSRILGKAFYRFWPLSRRGVPGHSARK